MRSVTYHIAASVDGFIASPSGDVSRFLYEGGHVADYLSALAEFDTVIMGRKTYQLALDQGVASPYPT